MVKLVISETEKDILAAIEEVGYGEIYEVHAGGDKPLIERTLTDREMSFIRNLRRKTLFNKLIIHDSEPTMAEIDGETFNRLRCLKKIKF